MKRISLFLFMIILVACTADNNSTGRSRRSKPIDVSEIEFHLQPGMESSIKQETSLNVNSSYSEEVKKFQIPVWDYTIDTNRDTNLIVGKRGTLLHIPENIMVDKTGNPYQGDVNIHFKEYTNSAEIAFSNIPMTYKQGKEELRFNSAGMFEITATGETGDELYIARGKSIAVDYKLVKKNPGTDFYRLDGNKNEWKKLSVIVPQLQRDSFVNADVVTYLRTWRQVAIQTDAIRTVAVTMQPVYGRQTRDTLIRFERGRIRNMGNIDSNRIVSGLSVAGFGMYNCDQSYRLSTTITVNAKYMDKETGIELKDLQTLSMIDLSWIGAFSFSPYQFKCDPTARNVLVLFTQSGELYFLDEETFRSMGLQHNTNYTFKMTNVTDQVKNTEDLQKLLGI